MVYTDFSNAFDRTDHLIILDNQRKICFCSNFANDSVYVYVHDYETGFQFKVLSRNLYSALCCLMFSKMMSSKE